MELSFNGSYLIGKVENIGTLGLGDITLLLIRTDRTEKVPLNLTLLPQETKDFEIPISQTYWRIRVQTNCSQVYDDMFWEEVRK